MQKMKSFLMGCCASGKGPKSVALCNDKTKSMNLPCMTFWYTCAVTGATVSPLIWW